MTDFEQFIGKWRAFEPYDTEEYLREYTVTGTAHAPRVEAVDLQDGEQFVVGDVAWDGTELSFTTRMPSTGRTGVCRFRAEKPDRIVSEFTYTVSEGLIRHGA